MNKKLEEAMAHIHEAEQSIVKEKEKQPVSAPQNITPTLIEERKIKDLKIEKVSPTAMSNPKQEPPEPKLSPQQAALRAFIKRTNAVYCENKGTQYEKWYATWQAWNYVARLNNVHPRVEKQWEKQDPLDKNALVVYTTVSLVDGLVAEPSDKENILTTVTMCASSNEKWLQGKPLSALYGLSQTRAEERAIKSIFGYQLCIGRLQPTAAEELDVDSEAYGRKENEV